MAAAKSENARAADVVRNWLRNRTTLEFLSAWEEIYNPEFKVFESEHFKKIQTDAVKNYIIPKGDYVTSVEWLAYAEEADILNVVLSAKAWRDANPELSKKCNVRDFATINELTVLSNLETHNAQMIREGKSKIERFSILKEIAKYQLDILESAEKLRLESKTPDR